MDTKVVLLDKILNELPKDDPARMKHTAASTKALAESIKRDGLLNPPTVEPHPEKKGMYRLIAGWGRFRAVKLLGEKQIAVNVRTDFDAETARAASFAENLFRQKYNKAAYLSALQVYSKLWADQITKEASARPAANGEANGHIEDVTPDDPSQRSEPTTMETVNHVAALTGQSRTAAHRDVKVTKTLTPEQLQALSAIEAPEDDIYKFVAIADAAERAQAINLYVSGQPVAEAISKASPESAKAAVDKAAKSAEKKAAEAPKTKPTAVDADAALSDEEWLERWCPVVRGKLKAVNNITFFDQAATLYRHTKTQLLALRTGVKDEVEKATKKAAGNENLLLRTLRNLTRISHPKDWLVCSGCDGCGLVGRVGPQACPKCRGDGFKINTEQG